MVLRKLARPCSLVDIAAHGGYRRDDAEFVEDFRIAHITGMNDTLRSPKGVERLGTKQAVGIGDDSDQDRGSQSGYDFRLEPISWFISACDGALVI